MAPLVVVTGADAFGEDLKNRAVEYLKTKDGVEVQDLGTDSYYSVAEGVATKVSGTAVKGADAGKKPEAANGDFAAGNGDKEVRGLLACGTGAGVSIVANKFPGVSAVCCDSAAAVANARSINSCNVLALSGLYTSPHELHGILDAWLSTEFKAPCPASKDQPWSEEISAFLDRSLPDVAAIEKRAKVKAPAEACPICDLASGRVFETVEAMPGGSWKVLRQDPASAVVRFTAGSVEPAHHHSFSHDIIVLSGHKLVQNVTQSASFELREGDFLSTPAGDVHRVLYFKDTEFFIKWDGPCDILLDEDLATARDQLKEFLDKDQ